MLDKVRNELQFRLMKILGIDRLFLFTYKNTDLEEFFNLSHF